MVVGQFGEVVYKPKSRSTSIGVGPFRRTTTEVPENPQDEKLKTLTIAEKQQALAKGSPTNKLDQVAKYADSFYGLLNQTNQGKGIAGRLSGLGTIVSSQTGQDPLAASYNQQLAGQAALLVKALGDVGAITEADKASAKKMLGDISNNYETNAQNAIGLQRILSKLGVSFSKERTPSIYAFTSEYRKSNAYKKAVGREKNVHEKAGVPFAVEEYAKPIDITLTKATPQDRVTVYKEGKPFNVPANQVEQALKAGYTRGQ